jgi:hypothetical protein
MVAAAKVYEKQVDGTLKQLTLLGELLGFDASDNAIYGPLTLRDLPPPSVDKHGLGVGNWTTPLIDNIPAGALAYQWVGLVSGTKYTNLSVKRHNAQGWSPASNPITFTVPAVQVVHDPVMGIPLNDEYDAGRVQFTQWDATRTYSIAQAKGDFTRAAPRVIGCTFGPQDSSNETSQAAGATELENFLEDFYYGAGSAARQNCEIHFATENETDNKHKTGSLSSAYVNTIDLCSQVIERVVGGARRYPKASMAIDMTQNQIRSNGAGPRFKVCAKFLRVFGCSMYPPGRQALPDVVFTSYAVYCDPVFAVLADWKQTGSATGGPLPNLEQFATWEFGIPIDHPIRNSSIASPPSGEPTANTNFTIRPRYVAGGIDSTGKDWKGYLQYVVEALDPLGVRMREQIYWNQQTNPDIPNPFWHDDSPRATPDTEHAWRNWTIGSRLPNG